MSSSQELTAALQEHGVVPDVIDAVSPTIEVLQVKYPSGDAVHAGNELTPTQVKDLPDHVLLPSIGHEGFTTLMMIDPDAPSRAVPSLGEIVHWLVVNIPADGDIARGDTLVEYCGAGAPQGTGLHRYIFLAYKQLAKLEADTIGIRAIATIVMPRMHFSTRNFSAKHNLSQPIAANFFRAQYDDYVPIARAKFTDRSPAVQPQQKS